MHKYQTQVIKSQIPFNFALVKNRRGFIVDLSVIYRNQINKQINKERKKNWGETINNGIPPTKYHWCSTKTSPPATV